MSILEQIAQSTRQRVQQHKAQSPVETLQQSSEYERAPRDFAAAFPKGAKDLRVIAEVKRASPSRGPIAPELEPVEVAQSYLNAGASALSVLTEPEYFQGSPEILKAIRQACPDALLLMKDFILDSYQLHMARACGADACLLMASLLDQSALQRLYSEALELGLTPLVEVHDAEEMQRARALQARLIGINNRNLKTLEIDLKTGVELAQAAPEQSHLICESGIRNHGDLTKMVQHGFDGFLVGTALMQTGQPGEALRELLSGEIQNEGLL